MSSRSFESTLAAVRDVEGWMSDGQARRLWDRAASVAPGGRIVEIGSYQGRSTIVLATAAAPDVEVIAIDPHAGNDRGPQQFEGPAAAGQADHEAFCANLAQAGVIDRVRHLRLSSQSAEARAAVAGPIDVLYIDGAHRLAPALADLRGWPRLVAPGGTLLVHDSFSSVGVTLSLLATRMGAGDFRYVGRVGSLAEYRHEPVAGRDRVNSALRQAAQLPWFARNVVIKALILARLGRLTRYLGHPEGNWPY